MSMPLMCVQIDSAVRVVSGRVLMSIEGLGINSAAGGDTSHHRPADSVSHPPAMRGGGEAHAGAR